MNTIINELKFNKIKPELKEILINNIKHDPNNLNFKRMQPNFKLWVITNFYYNKSKTKICYNNTNASYSVAYT